MKDEGEGASRPRSVEMSGEGCLGVPDKAVGLMADQGGAESHYAPGRHLTGRDREHGVVAFFQDGLDVADEHLAVGVAAVNVRDQARESIEHEPRRPLRCFLKDQPDIGQAHLGSA